MLSVVRAASQSCCQLWKWVIHHEQLLVQWSSSENVCVCAGYTHSYYSRMVFILLSSKGPMLLRLAHETVIILMEHTSCFHDYINSGHFLPVLPTHSAFMFPLYFHNLKPRGREWSETTEGDTDKRKTCTHLQIWWTPHHPSLDCTCVCAWVLEGRGGENSVTLISWWNF